MEEAGEFGGREMSKVVQVGGDSAFVLDKQGPVTAPSTTTFLAAPTCQTSIAVVSLCAFYISNFESSIPKSSILELSLQGLHPPATQASHHT